jgi:hypothetical protein
MRKRHCGVALAAIVVLGTISVGTPAFAAPKSKTIQVNPGDSIQAAIDAAHPGDTINVAAGTYPGELLISKDRINLVGHGATLTPGAGVFGNGITVADADFSGPTPVINHIVTGVSISGFTIDGQGTQGIGVFVFGASNTSLTNDVAINNFDYGFFANTSSGTTEANDSASGGGEAGFYIGDSPDANARLSKLDSFGNEFGIFVRDAEGVTLNNVNAHDNCIGVFVLADAPGPSGNVSAHASHFDHNTKACPPITDENFPPVSGIGVGIVGGNDVRLDGNSISRNVRGGDSPFSAGVVMIAGPGGTAPRNISIHGNHMKGNSQNFFSDGTAVNVKISGNH